MLFLCVVYVDTVFAGFPGSSAVLCSHQCSIPQGVDHLPCVADVCFGN